MIDLIRNVILRVKLHLKAFGGIGFIVVIFVVTAISLSVSIIEATSIEKKVLDSIVKDMNQYGYSWGLESLFESLGVERLCVEKDGKLIPVRTNYSYEGDMEGCEIDLPWTVAVDGDGWVAYVSMSIAKNSAFLMSFVLVSAVLFLGLIVYIIATSLTSSASLINSAGVSIGATNRMASILVDQLHHELNTPLAIISTSVNKIFSKVHESYESCIDKSECSIRRDYGRIKNYRDMAMDSIRQVEAIALRLSEAKNMKISNGDKSIEDIATSTANIMKMVYGSNREIRIDEELGRFFICEDTGLRNHELMSILMNHIKNSYEAKSSVIDISFGGYTTAPSMKRRLIDAIMDRDGCKYIKILIIDDGVGIPESVRNRIFSLYFTTKRKDGVVRGAGLYINRMIMRASGGDIRLKHTSSKGTTFEIIIRVKEKS